MDGRRFSLGAFGCSIGAHRHRLRAAWPCRPVRPYPVSMNDADTVPPLHEVLADHGRPVSPEGMARASAKLAARRRARDPQTRAAFRAQLTELASNLST